LGCETLLMEPLESVKPQTPDDIAVALKPFLQSEGISVRATCRDDCLYILLEAFHVPDRRAIVDLLQRQRNRSGIVNFPTVRIYFRRKPDKMVIWQEYLEWQALKDLPDDPSDHGLDPSDSDETATLVTDSPDQPARFRSVPEYSDAGSPASAVEEAGSTFQQNPQSTESQSDRPQAERETQSRPKETGGELSDRPAYAQAENDSVFEADQDSDQRLLDALAEALGTTRESRLSRAKVLADSDAQDGRDLLEGQPAPHPGGANSVDIASELDSETDSEGSQIESGPQVVGLNKVDNLSSSSPERALNQDWPEQTATNRSSALNPEPESDTPDPLIDSLSIMQPDSETVDRTNSPMPNTISDSSDETSSQGMSDPTPPGNDIPDPWEETGASTDQAIAAPQAQPSAAKAASLHTASQETDDREGSDPLDSETLKKPQALILLALYTIFIFVRAFLALLDSTTEDNDEDYSMSGFQLASRLGIRHGTLDRFKDRDYFGEWSKTLDPDGISWFYRSDGRFVPAIVQAMREEVSDADA